MATPTTRPLINRTRSQSRLVFPPLSLAPMMPAGHCGSIKTTSSCTMWMSRTHSGLALKRLPSANMEVGLASMRADSMDIKTRFTPTEELKCIWKDTSRYVPDSHLIYIFKTCIRNQGATDFIFGQNGHAYFGGNTIAVNGAGWVTASGRESDDNGSCAYPSLSPFPNVLSRASQMFSTKTQLSSLPVHWIGLLEMSTLEDPGEVRSVSE